MKLYKLALAAAFLPLLASCAPEQNGAQADASGATSESPVTRKAEKAAEQGDVAAQVALGDMHWSGEGVPQDYSQAVNWFRKAAEQGDAYAQLKLGIEYISGKRVPQDVVLGYAWSNLAAAQGNNRALNLRKLSADQLSPIQLDEAQRLSSNWQKGQSIQREKQ